MPTDDAESRSEMPSAVSKMGVDLGPDVCGVICMSAGGTFVKSAPEACSCFSSCREVPAGVRGGVCSADICGEGRGDRPVVLVASLETRKPLDSFEGTLSEGGSA